MLRIDIDNNHFMFETGGTKKIAMAEMMYVVHEFYNKLDSENKGAFRKSFLSEFDEIFSDNTLTDEDVNKACEEHKVKASDLIDALNEIMNVLKELEE